MSKNTLLSELINYVSYDGTGKVTVTTGLVVNNVSNGRIDVLPDYAQNYFVSYAPGAASQSKLVLISAGVSFRPGWGADIFMDITSSGLVGLGGVAPSYLLDLYTATSGTTSTILRLKNGYNDTSTGLRMRWDFASLPGAYLDVTTDSGGSKSMTLYLSAANAAPTQALQILGSNKAATFNGSVTASGGLITKGSSVNVNNSIKFLRADGPEMGYIGWSNESANNSTWLFKSSNGNTIGFSADGTNQNMVITTAAFVGIGLTNPSAQLHIGNGTSQQQWIVNQSVAGWYSGFKLARGAGDGSSTGNNNFGFVTTDNGLEFVKFSNLTNADGSRLMTINNSGNVGIGTTSPDSGLNINSGSTRGLRIDTNSGVQAISMSPNGIFGIDEPGVGNGRFIINTSGNVGIAVTSPSHRLQVSGNIYSSDTVFARNLKPEAFASVSAGTPTGATIPYGYSMISISTPCDNNWRSVLSNINDTKAYFWASIGDAASKDTANYFMSMTSPAYGVYNFGAISYQDNGWNTGSFEFSYDNSGNGTHRLLVRCSSYYNSGNTAYGNIYFLRME